MCKTIVINKGEIEIETPKEFLEFFGNMPEKKYLYNTLNINSCLCQVDFEKYLKENNIEFTEDWGFVYIENYKKIN